MRRLLKVLVLCIIIALISSTFSACAISGLGDGAKVKIRFAYNWTGEDSKASVFEPMLKKFQQDNPNIELVLEATPAMDHETKIKTDAAANNLPDSFNYWFFGYVRPLIDAGKLADLTDLATKDADLKDRFYDASYGGITVDDKIYGIPAESFFDALFVNTDIMKKYGLSIPKTFDDLKNASKVLKENGIIPIAEAGKGADPSMLFLNAFIGQAGGPTAVDDVMNKGDVSCIEKGAKYYQELVKLGAFPEGVNGLSNDEKMALFNEEKAAMMFDGSWMFGAIKPELNSKVDFAPLPLTPDAKVDASAISSGVVMYYVVSSQTAKNRGKMDAVEKLIKYLTTPEANLEMLEKASIPPCAKVTINESKLSPVMAKAMKLRVNSKQASPIPQDYFPPEVSQKLIAETQAQAEGIKTPKEYADFIKQALKEAKE